MTFYRGLIENDPQPDDDDATLIVNPFKLAAWGQPCILIDLDGVEHPFIKGSAAYRVFRSNGWKEKEKTS